VSGQELRRVLKLRHVLALAFGAMIGWGWVALTGEWLREAGALGAASAFLLGGVAVVLIGLTYAELAAAMPLVGGEHVYSFRALGPTASFICTWAILLGYISVVAFEAVALPTVVTSLLPGISRGLMWRIAGWDVHASWVAIGVAGAAVMTWINVVGVKIAAAIQTAVVIALVIAGTVMLLGAAVFGSIDNLARGPGTGISGLTAVLMMVPFMFVGFDVIPQAAEEIDLPHGVIGKALIGSVLVALAWYVLIILGVGMSLTPEQIALADLATADAASRALGSEWFGGMVLLAGIAGIMTSWNALLVGASRALYALAESRMLPVSLARLHPVYGTPYRAILLVGGLSCLAPFFGRPAMVWLANAGGLGIVLAYAMVAMSFLILRIREPQMPRPYLAPRGPLVGTLALVCALAMCWLYLPGGPAGLSWPQEWVIVIAWSVMGAALYAWALGRYGRASREQVLRLRASPMGK